MHLSGRNGAGVRQLAVYSSIRVVSESIAFELKRFFPLDAVAHGTKSAELVAECADRAGLTLVFDGSAPHAIEQLAWMLRALDSPRVVVYGLADERDDLRRCARLQVGGLVGRDAPITELAAAVDVVADGKHFASAALIPALMDLAACSRSFAADDLARLTERERQVAAMLTRGLTYAQIAVDLAVSPATVKNHVHNIYRKMRMAGQGERRLHSLGRS